MPGFPCFVLILVVLQARDALAALAEIASKYDADGIDVCFLNSKHVGNNMKVSIVRVRHSTSAHRVVRS